MEKPVLLNLNPMALLKRQKYLVQGLLGGHFLFALLRGFCAQSLDDAASHSELPLFGFQVHVHLGLPSAEISLLSLKAKKQLGDEAAKITTIN